MSAATTGSATTTMVATKAPVKRFELPALDFNFASLTEGTDIPPPLPSPVEEAPPKVVKAPKVAVAVKPKPKAAEPPKNNTNGVNGVNTSSKINGAMNGATSTTCTTAGQLPTHYRPSTNGSLNRRVDRVPASPTLSAHAGSIRRLFSRNLMNAAYANAEAEGLKNTPNSIDIHHSVARPNSRNTTGAIDERKSKRSSGWFRRLRGGGLTSSSDSINGDYAVSKRASMVLEEAPKPAKPAKSPSPPPPMIPELAKLKAKVEVDDDGSLGSDLFKNIK
ncbi:hypothetical protein CMQ_2844 [Grosmannia clavigera kw1407]|uniref:Uncharacterized protein n=1 Tax=Grosmannia clavigera (strain kw1407 / UAMH 11150) TaxID=655863 RepID=F0XGF1_GROCL|nr:uncharacterized protein CMQ_2844 [Grosmannia clavigera kw1407]EFX02915.1 hypothetical protein CMQ_2844 [Grosmannia clavigera kw1407]